MYFADLDKQHINSTPSTHTSTPLTTITVTTRLTYGNAAHCRTITLKPFPTDNHRFHTKQHDLHAIRDFIGHFKWSVGDPLLPGMSWLELLAASELTGHRLDKPAYMKRGPARAAPQMSLHKTLALFRQLFGFVAQKCMSEIDARYFSSSYANGGRFAP